jgi:hypothetical protein
MNLIVHPDLAGLAPLIAERIEAAIRERYGPVQVTFFIDDDIAAGDFSQAPPVTEVNGKNDPMGGREG